MDEYDAIMLVETVLYAKRMEQDGKIQTEEGENLESFALTMKEIAEKAQEAFGHEEDEYGGWDEAYATMEDELKKRYTEKTYYVTFRFEGRYTTDVNAKSIEEAKEKAVAYYEAANLNEADIIESGIVTVDDGKDIVWEA